jgi:four helix bundle protein
MLLPQLVRCATSIGANAEEARGAESRRGFISKCSIALKEARESSFRLRVFCSTCEDSRKKGELLLQEAEELAAILGSIVRNARQNVSP